VKKLIGGIVVGAVLGTIVTLVLLMPRSSPDELGPGTFRLTVEDLVESKDMLLVKKLTISVHGSRRVGVAGWGKRCEVLADQRRPQSSDIAHAELILLANLTKVPSPDGNQLTWLCQLHSSGSTAGAPMCVTVPHDQTFSDLATIEVASGDYPVGEELRLGTFKGGPLILTVK